MNELLATPVRTVIECIESWHNEDYTQWYRIYSDGFCEQGGFYLHNANPTKINLIKDYPNIRYHLQVTNAEGDANAYIAPSSFINKTKNSFDVISAYNGTWITDIEVYWEAKGYIK